MEGLRFPGVRYSTHLHRIVVPDALYVGPDNHVYLSFDDGPHPGATPLALDILKEHNIRASFFCVGTKVEAHPKVAQRVIEEGHTIGNHGYTHRRLMFQREDLIDLEVERGDNAIDMVCGVIPTLFRPPFGAFGPTLLKILRRRKRRMALWSLDSKDFVSDDVEAFVESTDRLIEPGTIVLLHDSELTERRIEHHLPPLLDRLLQRGLTFAALPS